MIAFEYIGPGFVHQWCFLRAVRSISVDVGHWRWVVVGFKSSMR